jgi:hypothetical protein
MRGVGAGEAAVSTGVPEPSRRCRVMSKMGGTEGEEAKEEFGKGSSVSGGRSRSGGTIRRILEGQTWLYDPFMAVCVLVATF